MSRRRPDMLRARFKHELGWEARVPEHLKCCTLGSGTGAPHN
jgi:hypothetical protein